MEARPRIIIAGGSGFIGQALAAFLSCKNFDVVLLTRGKSESRAGIRFANWDGKTVDRSPEKASTADSAKKAAGNSSTRASTPLGR
jgi:nucleoside-diphosphate-sugar epimerase